MCGHSSKLESRILNAEGRESVEECSERGFGGAGEDSRTGKESPESVEALGRTTSVKFFVAANLNGSKGLAEAIPLKELASRLQEGKEGRTPNDDLH
jgi:hypothetical protein